MDVSGVAERTAARGKKDFFERMIVIFLGLLAIGVAFPFYNTLIVSFADEAAVGKQLVYLLPVSIDFSAYKVIFEDSTIVSSFLVSVFITVAGTAASMLISTAGAYALSKKDYPGRNFFMNAIVFTMLFSGGLIPFYLTVKNLGLTNTLASLILPSLANTFYLIIMINYFRGIPASIEESAKIDGANDILILVRIIIPISVPTIAAISLFYAVDKWNAFYHAMLFISEPKKYPLQLMLREILVNYSQMFSSTAAVSMSVSSKPVYQESLKMAVVVVTALPILMVYPFIQKYFAKGIMIGSVKG